MFNGAYANWMNLPNYKQQKCEREKLFIWERSNNEFEHKKANEPVIEPTTIIFEIDKWAIGIKKTFNTLR